MPVDRSLRDVRVRRARSEDFEAARTVLSSAAAWARARGIERWWPVPFPPERLRPALENGHLFVAESGGEVVATLVFKWEDTRVWGDQPPVAGYVHMLAVRKDRPLRGLGELLLAWAADRTRENGRPLLRLDCLATNESLIRYYEGVGFRRVRVAPHPVPGETRGVQLFEREVG
jgi:ribosomal protein S18 acetylase RimI-like enzyme